MGVHDASLSPHPPMSPILYVFNRVPVSETRDCTSELYVLTFCVSGVVGTGRRKNSRMTRGMTW